MKLPEELAAWMRSHIPDLGDPGNVKFRSCKRIPFWWIPGNRDMAGLTIANHVFLREEYCPIDSRNAFAVELVFHEIAHVLQFRRNPVRFPFRYLWNHFRYGYARNPAEVEARQFAARMSAQYFSGAPR